MPQSLAKVYLHGIFSTKHREPLLADDLCEELYRVMGGAINNQGCQSLLIGGVEDHVHVLFELGRTVSIADVFGKMKSTSSAWIADQIGKEFHWQAGYAVFSVSQSNLEAVKIYIRNQREHHATKLFQDEVREWLRRYEIEWDERYLWD